MIGENSILAQDVSCTCCCSWCISYTSRQSSAISFYTQLKTSKVIKMNNEQDWGCRPKHSIMWWGCDICRFASSRWWWYTLTDNYKFLHSSLRNIHPLPQLPASCLCSGVSEEKQKYSNKKLTPHLLFFCPAAAETESCCLDWARNCSVLLLSTHHGRLSNINATHSDRLQYNALRLRPPCPDEKTPMPPNTLGIR